ncbi:MAG: hypothetical protein U0W24_01125 [Bacteroidales bacterium]
MVQNNVNLSEKIPEEDSKRNFKHSFLSLSFTDENKEFEKHFLAYFYSRSLNQVRFSVFLAIVLYSLFGILDAALIPEFKYKFWIIRYVIVIPLLITVLSISFTSFYKRYIQFISACIVILSSLGVIGIITLAPPDLGNYYFPGILLIIIMNYGFLKLRFIWASIAGLVSSLLYIIGSFSFIEMPFLLSVINSFFLGAVNIVGIFIARMFEIYARKEYFSEQLLKIEQTKLKTLSSRLEAKIKDKSQQIGNLQKEILSEIENLKKDNPSS